MQYEISNVTTKSENARINLFLVNCIVRSAAATSGGFNGKKFILC
jgi:hypothetical protein